MKPSVEILAIREQLILEEIESSRQKCKELGMPDEHFNPEMARHHIEKRDAVMAAAIIVYLDREATKEGEGAPQEVSA